MPKEFKTQFMENHGSRKVNLYKRPQMMMRPAPERRGHQDDQFQCITCRQQTLYVGVIECQKIWTKIQKQLKEDMWRHLESSRRYGSATWLSSIVTPQQLGTD